MENKAHFFRKGHKLISVLAAIPSLTVKRANVNIVHYCNFDRPYFRTVLRGFVKGHNLFNWLRIFLSYVCAKPCADKQREQSFSYQGEPRWTTSGWPASK